MIYGYLSDKENLQQFKKFCISEKNIYATREDIFNTVKSKDTIIFKNIDDLGKNFEEIKSNFDYLVVHGVILQFLEQPILNTLGKSAYKNLTERQKEIIGDFYIKKISFKEDMTLTGFSRATVY